MEAEEILVYDRHPDSPRLMFETPNGMRYTAEQWQLMLFMERLEHKLDTIFAKQLTGSQ